MERARILVTFWASLALASPGVGQNAGAARIEQIDSTRSSATVQSPSADRVPPLVSAETLAACQRAQAADRRAPAGVDCVRALQVSAAAARAPARAAPTAEGSLLNLIGRNADAAAADAGGSGGSADADQVARQLSAGDFQGTAGSDAAAIVARDRAAPPSAAPPSTPPPR